MTYRGRGTFVTPRWLVRTLVGHQEIDRLEVSTETAEKAKLYGQDWLVRGRDPEAQIDVLRLPD